MSTYVVVVRYSDQHIANIINVVMICDIDHIYYINCQVQYAV